MTMEWDKNSSGNVVLNPVRDFGVLTLHGVAVGVRLLLVPNPEISQKDSATEVVQVGLTVEQVDELIQILQLSVDLLRSQRPANPAN